MTSKQLEALSLKTLASIREDKMTSLAKKEKVVAENRSVIRSLQDEVNETNRGVVQDKAFLERLDAAVAKKMAEAGVLPERQLVTV